MNMKITTTKGKIRPIAIEPLAYSDAEDIVAYVERTTKMATTLKREVSIAVMERRERLLGAKSSGGEGGGV